MKRIAAIAFIVFAAHTSDAQNLKPAPNMPGATASAATPATASRPAPVKVRKTGIGGTIQNELREPVAKIQAYIYRGDDIIASGFSDTKGYYETNNVLPGTYTLRLVYPKSGRRITVPGVPVKMKKVTIVNYKGIEPVGDSTIAYTDLMPPPPPKVR
ncbi:MAG: carboxypeptidase regulatory-like domain-containing protein [Taibaiella sp.]|nr:carboxypeptidase regulatory-like domain-containing protein [Taibaiella sp.]